MSSSGSFTSISEDMVELLEGRGRRLEEIGIVLGEPTFAVITYRVDLGHRPSFRQPPELIKFSETRHAIPESPVIKLGSSRYYREHEDDNLADPEEGRLVQSGTLREFCKKNGIPSQLWSDNVSTTVTWERSDFLMFCTSVLRQGRGLGELRSQFPDYDCATVIPNPSAFAMQLGRDIGGKIDLKDVEVRGFERIRQMMLSQAQITTEGHLIKKGLDTVVLVSHGPVTYCDPPERIINRFPIELRGEVVPFVKRGRFARQHEYRFMVDLIGESKCKRFSMEVSDELRSLTRPFIRR